MSRLKTFKRKLLQHKLTQAILYRLAYMVYRTLTLTYRIDYVNSHYIKFAQQQAQQSGMIYGLWHEHFFTAVVAHAYQGIAPMISQSSDGEFISFIAHRLGFRPVRGSTSRGGQQAREQLYHHAAQTPGFSAAFTADGPRGPRRRLKSGIIDLSRQAQLPIVPFGIAASRAWYLHKSWDCSMIPKPFSRVVVVYNEPILVAPQTHGQQFAQAKKQVTERLNEACDHAQLYLGLGLPTSTLQEDHD